MLAVSSIVCVSLIGLAFLGAVKIVFEIKSTVTETLSGAGVPFVQAGSSAIVHSGLNVAKTLDANTAGRNVEQTVYGQLAMTAGAATLNLAAVTGLNGDVVDLTGLKIRTMQFRAKSDNANPITVEIGASNGYTGLGAGFSLTLSPGLSAAMEPSTVAVASGVRTLDVSGTGTQVLEFIFTAGSN